MTKSEILTALGQVPGSYEDSTPSEIKAYFAATYSGNTDEENDILTAHYLIKIIPWEITTKQWVTVRTYLASRYSELSSPSDDNEFYSYLESVFVGNKNNKVLTGLS